MRFNIRNKLIVIILTLVLIPLSFLGTHIYKVANKALTEKIGQSLKLQAKSMMEQIDRLMYERQQNVQDWSQEERLLDILEDDPNGVVSEFLGLLKKQYGFYEAIFVADNAGKIIAASDKQLVGQNVKAELWFDQTMGASAVMSSIQTDSKIFKGYKAFISAPILAETILKQVDIEIDATTKKARMKQILQSWQAKNLGVMGAVLDWTVLLEFVNSTPVLESKTQDTHAYAMLLNSEGMALTQPYFEDQAVAFWENLAKNKILAAQSSVRGQSGHTLEKGRHGRLDFIGYAASTGFRNYPGFGWSILVFQDSVLALAPIREVRLHVIAVAGFVAILSALVALLFAGGISRPIEKLAQFTRVVGSGDFTSTINIRTGDEIGTLANSLNDMIVSLNKAKNEITVSRDYTNNIVNSIGDVLIVIDDECRVKSSNHALEILLGYKESEIKGISVDRFFPAEYQKNQNFMKLLREGNVENMEIEISARGGDVLPMMLSASRLKGTGVHQKGAVLTFRDMRDLKSMQNKFMEAQKMDAIGRLSGGVAHDFNNMLTVINGYSEQLMMAKTVTAEQILKKSGEILKAGRRAARLVGQLLAFSRRQTSKPTVIDLNHAIKGLDKMLRLVTGVRIEVVILLDETAWPAKLDSGQFEQVVTNLTVNARDAMPEGGKLAITTKNVVITERDFALHPDIPKGEYVVMDVSDTGTGMTEEVKRRIFEPFFTTKAKGKGTGLGLASCFDFIKEAKGYIEVDTVLGKGTSFKLYFPKAEGKAQNLKDQEIPTDLPTGTESILVVDDEDLVRDFTAKALMGLGYQVYQAMNGQSALKIFEEQKGKVDLLLTDIVMPDMNGRQLAEKLQHHTPNLKVIFMSGFIDDDDFILLIEENKVAFLQKPILASTLAMTLRNVIQGTKVS